MPGVLVTVATVGGSVGIGWAGAALWIAGPLVVGALCAYGIRAGYAVTAPGRRTPRRSPPTVTRRNARPVAATRAGPPEPDRGRDRRRRRARVS